MRALPLLALLLATPAGADSLRCVADQQCRGDAQAMCAPASTEFVLDRAGWLWIDHQGPYSVRPEGAGRWVVTAFGGSHALELIEGGSFRYLGNRGKRYTGECQDAP